MPIATGALLARALPAHPSLTSLSLIIPPLSPQWLRAFTACLVPGSLPALLDLTLGVDANPGGCTEAAACLRLLPSLTSVDISFHLSREAPSAASCLAAYARLTAATASLLLLKRMDITEGELSTGDPDDAFTVATVPRRSCIPSFLPLLSAPQLSRVELRMHAAASSLRMALAPLSRFPALESLTITGTLQPSAALQPLEDFSSSLSSASDTPMLSVSSVRVQSVCPVTVLAAGAMAAFMARASLKALVLDSRDVDDGADMAVCSPDEMHRARTELWPMLSMCTGLEHLQLAFMNAVPPQSRRSFSRCLLISLAMLTRLTHLVLASPQDTMVEGPTFVSGQMLGQALATLSELQEFRVEPSDGGFTVKPVQPVLDACCRLKKLTCLSLRLWGVTFAQIDAFLAGRRSLKRLGLARGAVQRWAAGTDECVATLNTRYPDVSVNIL